MGRSHGERTKPSEGGTNERDRSGGGEGTGAAAAALGAGAPELRRQLHRHLYVPRSVRALCRPSDGSFVTAGAELVSHDVGITGKVIAIVAFLLAAALTAGLI